METKNGNEKRFWSSLFSSKPCSCKGNLNVEETGTPAESCCDEEQKTATKGGVKEIKVLGPGCTKCKTTCQIIEKVIHENNLDVKLIKIEDIAEIMNYRIMGTPAVVVDGAVKIKGRIPSEGEIKQILGI